MMNRMSETLDDKLSGTNTYSSQQCKPANCVHIIEMEISDKWNVAAKKRRVLDGADVAMCQIPPKKILVNPNDSQISYKIPSHHIQKNKILVETTYLAQSHKIQVKKQKSKIPLFLSAGITSSLIITSLMALPPPFNYIASIALAGPLSASIMGLRK